MFYMVIPDDAIEFMTKETDYFVLDLENKHYDAYSLSDELKWYDENGSDNSNFILREYARLTGDAEVGALIVGTMYVAVVFICMALAILSMKTLSTVQQDKKRFDTLYRLGASEKVMRRTLLKINFFCFAVPFAIPFALCIPTGAVLGKMFALLGMAAIGTQLVLSSVGIAAVMLIVYTIYFLVTCRISRENIIAPHKI